MPRKQLIQRPEAGMGNMRSRGLLLRVAPGSAAASGSYAAEFEASPAGNGAWAGPLVGTRSAASPDVVGMCSTGSRSSRLNSGSRWNASVVWYASFLYQAQS